MGKKKKRNSDTPAPVAAADSCVASPQRNYNMWLLLMLGLTVMALLYGPVTYHLRTFKSTLVMAYSFLFMVVLVLQDVHGSETVDRRGSLVLLLLFLHAMYTYIVGLCTGNAYDSAYYLGTLIALFAWSYVTWRCARRMDDPRIVWLGVTPLFIILGAWATVQLMSDNSANRFQFTLSFGNVNFFACYLAGFVPLLLAGIFQRKGRLWIALAFVSATLCLLGTQSRGGLGGTVLAMVVFFACYFFLLRERRSKVPALFYFFGSVVVVALALLTLWATAPFFLRRAVQFFTNLEYEAVTRITPWIAAVGMWLERPFFGHGLGCFYRNVFRFETDISGYAHTLSFRHAHNEYLELLADGGVIGLVWWLGVIGFVLWKLWKIVKDRTREYEWRLLACGVMCGLIGMLGHYGVDEASRTSTSMTAFYFLLGLALWTFEKQYGAWRPLAAWHTSLAIFVVAALATFPIFRSFMADHFLVKAISDPRLPNRISYLEEAVRYHSENVYVTNEMCQSYYYMRQLDKAFQWAVRIDEIIPNYRDNNLFLAVCYADQQRYTDAQRKLAFYHKIYPYKDQGHIVAMFLAKQQGWRDIYLQSANNLLRAVITVACTQHLHVAVPNLHVVDHISFVPPELAKQNGGDSPWYAWHGKQVWVYLPAELRAQAVQEMWATALAQQNAAIEKTRETVLRMLNIPGTLKSQIPQDK